MRAGINSRVRRNNRRSGGEGGGMQRLACWFSHSSASGPLLSCSITGTAELSGISTLPNCPGNTPRSTTWAALDGTPHCTLNHRRRSRGHRESGLGAYLARDVVHAKERLGHSHLCSQRTTRLSAISTAFSRAMVFWISHIPKSLSLSQGDSVKVVLAFCAVEVGALPGLRHRLGPVTCDHTPKGGEGRRVTPHYLVWPAGQGRVLMVSR
jgi:hypothetical protein